MRSSHRQNYTQKKLMYMGIGVVALIIFMAVFGLNFIINASVWIGSIFSGNKPVTEAQNNDFFGALFVDDLPTATNSADLIITGSQSDFDKLTFYVNGEEVEEITIKDDTFSEQISGLTPGENTIKVKATATKAKQSKESDTYTVVYKNKKPKLEIAEPANESTVNSQEITIKGQTDPEVSVEIDGSPVVVSRSGAFQDSIRLKEGENMITIVAIDNATNESKVEIKVTYKKDE